MNTLGQVVEIFRYVMEDDNLDFGIDFEPLDLDCWDSFKHVQIFMRCEEVFGIRFRVSEIELIKNISDLVLAIEKKLER